MRENGAAERRSSPMQDKAPGQGPDKAPLQTRGTGGGEGEGRAKSVPWAPRVGRQAGSKGCPSRCRRAPAATAAARAAAPPPPASRRAPRRTPGAPRRCAAAAAPCGTPAEGGVAHIKPCGTPAAAPRPPLRPLRGTPLMWLCLRAAAMAVQKKKLAPGSARGSDRDRSGGAGQRGQQGAEGGERACRAAAGGGGGAP